MGRWSELVAWVLSLAGLALAGGLAADLSLAGASALAVAALPWVALAGLPRGSARRADLVACASALPPLALGAGLDVSAGRPEGAVLLLLAESLALVFLLAFAAERAAGAGEGARALHALLWLFLVPVAAALSVALSWAPAHASGTPGAWAAAGRWAPLVWLHAAVLRPDAATGSAAGPLGAALLLGVLALAARRVAAERGAGGPARDEEPA